MDYGEMETTDFLLSNDGPAARSAFVDELQRSLLSHKIHSTGFLAARSFMMGVLAGVAVSEVASDAGVSRFYFVRSSSSSSLESLVMWRESNGAVGRPRFSLYRVNIEPWESIVSGVSPEIARFCREMATAEMEKGESSGGDDLGKIKLEQITLSLTDLTGRPYKYSSELNGAAPTSPYKVKHSSAVFFLATELVPGRSSTQVQKYHTAKDRRNRDFLEMPIQHHSSGDGGSETTAKSFYESFVGGLTDDEPAKFFERGLHLLLRKIGPHLNVFPTDFVAYRFLAGLTESFRKTMSLTVVSRFDVYPTTRVRDLTLVGQDRPPQGKGHFLSEFGRPTQLILSENLAFDVNLDGPYCPPVEIQTEFDSFDVLKVRLFVGSEKRGERVQASLRTNHKRISLQRRIGIVTGVLTSPIADLSVKTNVFRDMMREMVHFYGAEAGKSAYRYNFLGQILNEATVIKSDDQTSAKNLKRKLPSLRNRIVRHDSVRISSFLLERHGRVVLVNIVDDTASSLSQRPLLTWSQHVMARLDDLKKAFFVESSLRSALRQFGVAHFEVFTVQLTGGPSDSTTEISSLSSASVDVLARRAGVQNLYDRPDVEPHLRIFYKKVAVSDIRPNKLAPDVSVRLLPVVDLDSWLPRQAENMDGFRQLTHMIINGAGSILQPPKTNAQASALVKSVLSNVVRSFHPCLDRPLIVGYRLEIGDGTRTISSRDDSGHRPKALGSSDYSWAWHYVWYDLRLNGPEKAADLVNAMFRKQKALHLRQENTLLLADKRVVDAETGKYVFEGCSF